MLGVVTHRRSVSLLSSLSFAHARSRHVLALSFSSSPSRSLVGSLCLARAALLFLLSRSLRGTREKLSLLLLLLLLPPPLLLLLLMVVLLLLLRRTE